MRLSYRDFLQAPTHQLEQLLELPPPKRRGPRGGVVAPFPEKLYSVLQYAIDENLEDVIAWQSHGRCFFIYQPEAFVNDIMPK